MKLHSLNELKNSIPIIGSQKYLNEKSIILSCDQFFFSVKCLKLNFNYQYSMLSCISGIDLLKRTYRFNVSYELLSLTFNVRLRIKVFLNEITPICSIVELYINAN